VLVQIGGEDPVVVGEPVPLLSLEKPEVKKPEEEEGETLLAVPEPTVEPAKAESRGVDLPEPTVEPAKAESRGGDLPAAEQSIDFAQ
jgi:hypothetical protein